MQPLAKCKPSVGDVFMSAETAHADRFDGAHRRPHERQQQVEIVNHQIHDHADIGGASGERAPCGRRRG